MEKDSPIKTERKRYRMKLYTSTLPNVTPIKMLTASALDTWEKE